MQWYLIYYEKNLISFLIIHNVGSTNLKFSFNNSTATLFKLLYYDNTYQLNSVIWFAVVNAIPEPDHSNQFCNVYKLHHHL